MPTNDPTVKIDQFLGLRNTERPARLPAGALVQAVNVDIDDTGGIARRRGYASSASFTNITAAYATRDEQSLYVVDAGSLKRVITLSPLVTELIATGIPGGELDWAEAGNLVMYAGAAQGVIDGSTLLDFADFGGDGLDVAVQGEALQRDEAAVGTMPAPRGERIAFFEGRVWMSVFDSSNDTTFIFSSKPFHWGRWDLHTDYIAVPGHVNLLADAGGALLIGTDRAIHLYAQETMRDVANYGSVPGRQIDYDESGAAYFWTRRGLCKAAPFQNLTDDAVSVEPGTRCAVSIARERGANRVLIVVTGTAGADNPYE